MKQELEDNLYNAHPEVLAVGRKQCFIDVGDGWYNIIDTTCVCIESHLENHGAKNHLTPAEFKEQIQIKAVQIKEKFGGLRFYVENGDDYTRGVIAMAETMAYKTCSICGGFADNTCKWSRRCQVCKEAERETNHAAQAAAAKTLEK